MPSRNKFKELNLFWRGQDDGYRGGAVAASDLRLQGAFLLFLVWTRVDGQVGQNTSCKRENGLLIRLNDEK